MAKYFTFCRSQSDGGNPPVLHVTCNQMILKELYMALGLSYTQYELYNLFLYPDVNICHKKLIVPVFFTPLQMF